MGRVSKIELKPFTKRSVAMSLCSYLLAVDSTNELELSTAMCCLSHHNGENKEYPVRDLNPCYHLERVAS